MADIRLSVRAGAAWGRLATALGKTPVQAAADKALLEMGRQARARLQEATPVKTGYMRANWQTTYQPAQKRLTITDRAFYWGYVAFGTSRRRANPALQRVLTQDLPRLGQTAIDTVGREIVQTLKGE